MPGKSVLHKRLPGVSAHHHERILPLPRPAQITEKPRQLRVRIRKAVAVARSHDRNHLGLERIKTGFEIDALRAEGPAKARPYLEGKMAVLKIHVEEEGLCWILPNPADGPIHRELVVHLAG